MSLSDITLLWTGINACLPSVMLGAILIPALSVVNALWAIGLGSLFLCIVIYLTGLPGVKQGISSTLLSRRVFGFPFGTFLPALVIVISMAGWSAILLAAGGEAAAEVTPFHSSYIVIILAGVSAGTAAFMGEKAIRWSNLISVPLITILLVWLAFELCRQYPVTGLLAKPGNGAFGLMHGFDLIVGGTIAGAFVSSDLARFAVNRRSLAGGLLMGNLPVNLGLGLLGIVSCLATGNWNPLVAVGKLGMGIPALVLIILTVLTTIQPSIYSGGLVFANLFPSLNRRTATVVVCLPALVLALAGIFAHFESWLMMLNILLVPMVGAMIAAVLRPNGDSETTGISYRAVAAVIFGIAAGLIRTPLPQTVLSLVVSMAVYWLMPRSIR